MQIPLRLSFYIGRQFLLCLGLTFGVVGGLILLIDFIELLRRSGGQDIPFFILIQMALLKFPQAGQKILPFAMLTASVLSYTRLTRHFELIIARSAGLSVWQFLLPAVLTTVVIGILLIVIINPLTSAMLSRYEQLEAKYFEGQISSLAISSSGLWLRQKNTAQSGPPNGRKGESIIHASRAGSETGVLYDVIIFILQDRDHFTQRIDARRAELANDYWRLEDVVITSPENPAERFEEYFLETELTLEQIQDSLASPETLSFWDLPDFIVTLQEAGFSALRHRLYWHSILATPLLFAGMVSIGLIFSLKLPRFGSNAVLIASSVMVGFIIYFMQDLIAAIALSGSIPIWTAAWAPAVIVLLASIATLLHLEEG